MEDLRARLAAALAGRYTIEREIGRGGMSMVYLARDLRNERRVALKVLRPDLAQALGPDRFLREIKVAATLAHPHILPLFDSDIADGLLFYTMPYVEGESLRHRLQREGRLPVTDAVQIARDVADALAYAHSQNIVHRDIKPENILIEAGHPVVSDFGIARAISAANESRMTGSGIVVGTVDYMSPEQANGEELDGRSDIYSLGVVTYEMLSGHVPRFEVDGTIKTLERLRLGLSTAVVDILGRSLATRREDRFATASDLVAALGRGGGSRPFYQRRGLQISAVPALALLAVGTWIVLGGFAKPLDDRKVVVFPLAERGRSGVGDQVALLIGSALEHTEPLQWIDGWRLLGPAQRENIADLSAKSAQRITRGRGARYFLQGSIVERGDSASVILWLTDAKSGSDVARVSAAGSTRSRSLPQLGLEAVTDILPRLLPPGGKPDLTVLTGRRPAAVANWLQGEREYRRSNFAQALTYFRRAIGEDSALAAAALRGAYAASWENNEQEAATLAAVALRNAGLLPPRQASFARGLAAYFAGQADTAVQWLTRALHDSPDWTEAHMILGETYYHELPNTPGALDSLALVEFAAAAADSGFAPPRFHLAEIAIRSGDLERAANAVADFGRAAPEALENAALLRLMLNCATRKSVDWKTVAHAEPFRALKAGQALLVGGAFPNCAEDALRAILEDTTIATNYRWGALVGLQSLLAAQNRIRELRGTLDSAINNGMEFAKRFYLLDVLAGVDVRPAATAVEDEYEKPGAERSHPPSVLWLLGTWRAQRGDLGKAEAWSRMLEREAQRGDVAARRYGAALAASLALRRGDTSAVARLRTLLAIGTRDDLAWNIAEPLAADRLLLAEFFLAHDRPADAMAVARTIDHTSATALLPFLPASLVLRSQAARALGLTDVRRHLEQRLSNLGRADLAATQPHSPQGRSQ